MFPMFRHVAFGIALGSLAVAQTSGPVVKGDGVSYLGVRNVTQGIEWFYGIPFAEPPVGSLRFKPPRPWTPVNNSHVVNATQFGPACEQENSFYPIRSEDCLTLDMWRPANITGKLPVMVWIYGGGWYGGYAAAYPGSEFVPGAIRIGKPVIYVGINYRVGTYGFPPGQAAADAGGANLGLKDQRLALEWVQKNIAYFGGDPKKVTLFGESAGAISAGYQTLYKGGNIDEAFRGIILQSGSPSSRDIRSPNSPPLEAAYRIMLNVTGCTNSTDPFECLRSAPADVMKEANKAALEPPPESQSADPPIAIGPVVYPGDEFLPEQPADILRAGSFAKVPFINGAQLDEGTIFVSTTYPETEEDIFDLLTDPTSIFGFTDATATRELLSYYPADPAAGSPYGTGNETFGFAAQWKRLSSIVGDYIFQANRRTHLQVARQFGVPSWSFLFTETIITDPAQVPYGVRHTGEILFVLQGVHLTEGASEGLIKLEESVLDYWRVNPRFKLRNRLTESSNRTTFAHQLDPNSGVGERPFWPQYGSNATLIQLASNISTSTDTFREEGIEFLQAPYLYQ